MEKSCRRFERSARTASAELTRADRSSQQTEWARRWRGVPVSASRNGHRSRHRALGHHSERSPLQCRTVVFAERHVVSAFGQGNFAPRQVVSAHYQLVSVRRRVLRVCRRVVSPTCQVWQMSRPLVAYACAASYAPYHAGLPEPNGHVAGKFDALPIDTTHRFSVRVRRDGEGTTEATTTRGRQERSSRVQPAASGARDSEARDQSVATHTAP